MTPNFCTGCVPGSSVTGGWLQAALSACPEASLFFQGGITAYNHHQKCRHLGGDPAEAIRCNCVSEQMAADMAQGVVHSFGADWGLSCTGYASVIPGVENLFCCCAIVRKGQQPYTWSYTAQAHEPIAVQREYAVALLWRWLEVLG